MVINCSEPITAHAEDAFYTAFSGCGLKQEVISSCYAMAETTFAVSQSLPGKVPMHLRVSEKDLRIGKATESDESATVLVSSGELLPISEVKIVDSNGAPLPEKRIGEIWIRSGSMFDGYYKNGSGRETVFSKGYYKSGDLGFLARNSEGRLELFVTGRKKDLIIIAGENHSPHEIEMAVEEVSGVKAGRSAAIGVFDERLQTEMLVIGVEHLKAQLDSIQEKELVAAIQKKYCGASV